VRSRPRSSHVIRRGLSIPDWAVWALGAAFVAAAIFSGVLAFTTVRGLAAAWTGTGPNPFQGSAGSASAGGTPLPGGTDVPADLLETPPPWNGTDRVTILLMGLDYRDWLANDGPPRTDSMMLVTIDPVTHTAGMLSIPRDLWVEIPGFEHNRINTAYPTGEGNKLPGGGPGLAMKTVENLLGVPIQYYAVIDFYSFEKMIDEVGGIDILVTQRVKISPINRESRWLSPQSLHLDGADALAYARARHTEGGDFDRANRQQQVAWAVRDRILNVNMIPTLLTKAPALYAELGSGVRTNLTLDQIISLAMLALRIPNANMHNGVIAPPDMVLLETLPDGSQVLKPVTDKIRELRDQVFTATGAIAPSAPADNPVSAAKVEAARVSVLNGAGVEGLGTQTADYLKAQGLNVIEVANADRLDYDKSRLIVQNREYPYAVRYLAGLLNLSQSQILNPVTPDDKVDIIVILGRDWAQYVQQQGGLH
jgi:polyisoprenyl-teichoic acid--peptidoglycan teichoic acid transferase